MKKKLIDVFKEEILANIPKALKNKTRGKVVKWT
jgi:hypothetical protein